MMGKTRRMREKSEFHTQNDYKNLNFKKKMGA